MTTINALLTLKPTSPVPKCGEQHIYSLTERISKTGKPWTKAKAEGPGYGKLYEVISVEKTDFVDSHGNFSYNIYLVDLSGEAGLQGASNKGPIKDTSASKIDGWDVVSASPPQSPTVRSTSSNDSTTSTVTLARCIDDAIALLDARLTALTEAATPDARLDAVLRVAMSLFIQSHK
jgi:hypothetical protein